MPIKTAKVKGRRKCNYVSFEELLADSDRISNRHVKVLGNWSEGQIFQHLALAYNGSIDGFTMTFPWHFRMLAKVFKKKLMTMSMPPGFTLPGDGAKALAPEHISTEEGLAALRAAVTRLERDPHRARHPMLGELTREEWNVVHLNHANLHMSFLVPVD